MRPYKKSHRSYRVCPRCGANLDPGERCDCDFIEKENK